MSGTTINIRGNSNDTNLVLGSASASISDNSSRPAPVPIVPVSNVADYVLAGRMFLEGNLLFYFLSNTQMIRLRINPDVSYNDNDLVNRNWWLNTMNAITDFVYNFDSAVYDASQNVHLKGNETTFASAAIGPMGPRLKLPIARPPTLTCSIASG